MSRWYLLEFRVGSPRTGEKGTGGHFCEKMRSLRCGHSINVLWVSVQDNAYERVKLRMEWEAVVLLHTLNIAKRYSFIWNVPVLCPLTSDSVHLWKNLKIQRR